MWDNHDSTPISDANGNGLPANADGSLSGYVVGGYFILTLRGDPISSLETPAYPNVTPSLWDQPQNDHLFLVKTWRYQKPLIPNNLGCNPVRSTIAAETEIATDCTVDDGTGNFGNAKGGYRIPNQSAHCYGGLPVGGNVFYMDGHVANRPFTKASQLSAPGSTTPYNPAIIQYRCTAPGGNVRFRF